MSKKKYFDKEAKRIAKNATQRKCNPGWYERHKGEILERSRRHARTVRARYTRLLYVAKKRNLEMKISFEEFEEWITLPCFYCGGPLEPVGYGLDRIDPGRGYLDDNVRACCKRCNLAKNDMTETEFKEWIFRIYHAWVCR